MNKPRSCISAFFLISCVWAASAADSELSPYISRVSLPDGAKMRIGKGRVNFIAYAPDSLRRLFYRDVLVFRFPAGVRRVAPDAAQVAVTGSKKDARDARQRAFALNGVKDLAVFHMLIVYTERRCTLRAAPRLVL